MGDRGGREGGREGRVRGEDIEGGKRETGREREG